MNNIAIWIGILLILKCNGTISTIQLLLLLGLLITESDALNCFIKSVCGSCSCQGN